MKTSIVPEAVLLIIGTAAFLLLQSFNPDNDISVCICQLGAIASVAVIIRILFDVSTPDYTNDHLLRKLIREQECLGSELKCENCQYRKRSELPWILKCSVFGHRIGRKTDKRCLLHHCDDIRTQKEIDKAAQLEKQMKVQIKKSEIKTVIAEFSAKKAEEIDDNDRFMEDLEMDSIGYFMMLLELEERTGVEIDYQPPYQTVKELMQSIKNTGKEVFEDD